MRALYVFAMVLASAPALAADGRVQQPPEPALHNLSAAEKLAQAHEWLNLPSRDLADNGSSDADACRAIAETFAAGDGIRFLEPDVMTTTARPDELRTVEGQCRGLVLDEVTLPRLGQLRARRNFSLYFLARPVNGMAMSVFSAERWCKDGVGARAPCTAPQTARAFDLNSCKVVATETMPARNVTNGRSNYVQGVLEYRNDYYFANIGDVCETATPGVTGITMDITSVELAGGKPKLSCSLSTVPKARCVQPKR
ncbi:MAG: hypothetical protein K1X51_11610 [Rhodospirillaceae bacterium]|nr:hypothetical protein [Rhodospirillaceae bacterium]